MDDLGAPCQVSNAKSHHSMVAQLLVRDVGKQFLREHLGSLETEGAWEHRELLSALFRRPIGPALLGRRCSDGLSRFVPGTVPSWRLPPRRTSGTIADFSPG
jgi:hypothetical protein